MIPGCQISGNTSYEARVRRPYYQTYYSNMTTVRGFLQRYLRCITHQDSIPQVHGTRAAFQTALAQIHERNMRPIPAKSHLL